MTGAYTRGSKQAKSTKRARDGFREENLLRGDTLSTSLEMNVKNIPVWTMEVYGEKCERW